MISLKGDVYHVARERRPEEALRLVQTLLCGKGEEATKLILDYIQEPDIPELQVISPPESEITDEYSVTIFKSKKNSLQDIENLLAKGEATEVYVSRTNFSQYDPHVVDHRNNNYLYTDSINLSFHYDTHVRWDYYLFFNDNRWIVASEASAFMASIHGDPCSEAELISLKNDVYQIARERRPENAWRLVQTLLCGKGEQATKFIFDHIQLEVSTNSIERPDDPYGNDYPYMRRIWPPYSEDQSNDVELIYKSKNDNPEDFEDLLIKGGAYRAAVSPASIGYKIDKIDKPYKNYVYRNYIYAEVISLYANLGRNNGIISETYHLFFENDRWVIVAIDPTVG